MTDAEVIADRLLSAASSRIAVSNLFDGLRLNHYDVDFLKCVLRWWGEFVVQTAMTGSEIAASLGMLNQLFEGRLPSGFVNPSVPLLDPHIRCRLGGGLGDTEKAASVREASTMVYWADPNDIRAMKDEGIDILTRSGHISYSRLARRKPSSLKREIKLKVPKTITDARKGTRSIFFFTNAEALITLVEARPFDERADTARDSLGLVHFGSSAQLIVIVFPSELAETRADRGRPTTVDAQGNPRFLCETSDKAWEPGWGRTADLASPGSMAAGLPERVCGPLPASAAADLDVEVHLLGVVHLPRGDLLGVGDDAFSSYLEGRTSANYGRSLRDLIVEYLT
jgi:hypothetical protein